MHLGEGEQRRPTFFSMSEEIIDLIEKTGVLGGFYDAKGKRRVHRLLMKSEYHVYLVRLQPATGAFKRDNMSRCPS